MSLLPRLVASGLVAVAAVTAAGLASPAVAEPRGDGDSAADVVVQLQKQGYQVTVNGSTAGETSMLTTCTVTSIQKPDATKIGSVDVSVACPITHG